MITDGTWVRPDRYAEVKAALEKAGLPAEASLDDLIQHHRAQAAVAATFDTLATIEAVKAKIWDEGFKAGRDFGLSTGQYAVKNPYVHD